MKTKSFNLFLLLASLLICSALVISCSREKNDKPAAQQPAKVEAVKPPSLPTVSAPAVKKDGPVSLDFDNSPLSEVALFVTSQTG